MHEKTLERSVAEIAETLKYAKRAQRGATLLIGAGCSASAGIPLASEFVGLIRDMFPARCKRLGNSDYAQNMALLADGERHDLLAPTIDKGRVNWAHMAIAQLMKHEYVSRVLTTNFDPLMIQACAIAGIFPAVYDLASSSIFKPAQVRDPSVFYLHGQRLGFVMLNTEEQVRSHFETLKPVFDRAGEGRVWIVAGYSGVNDPVFSHLAAVDQFGHNLYWVGYGEDDPPEHVSNLISRQRCAYYVRGYDADRFFVELAQSLDCFPPEIVSKPFSHLAGFLEYLMPFPPMPGSSQDLKEAARTRIQKAIDAFETGDSSAAAQDLRPEALDAMSLLFSGKTDEVLALYDASSNPSDELREAAAWAHITVGNSLCEQARSSGEGPETDRLWEQACERYAEAVRIKPDKHEALFNCGIAFAGWARTKTFREADRLWEQACGRYAEAVRIKPDKHDALYNWGIALAGWARTKTGEQADRLWEEACGRYSETVRIKPDRHDALYNWGIALADWSKTKTGDDADRLREQACERYAEAVRIKPDKDEALNNWGSALDDWARTKTGAEADRLWEQACSRYAEAVRIKPDQHDALNNWGIAFAGWARTKTGADADRLWEQACSRYAEAVRIKPDEHEALYNWGIALAVWAKTKTGAEADRLWEQACGRYAETVRIKPDKHDALNNWGIALAGWARTKTGEDADRLWEQACGRYAEAVRIKPDKAEALDNWAAAFLCRVALAVSPEMRAHLLTEAEEKCLRAEAIVPGRGSYNMACVYALRNDAENCRLWLLRSKEHNRLPSRDNVLSDPDLAPFRDEPWLLELVAEG